MNIGEAEKHLRGNGEKKAGLGRGGSRAFGLFLAGGNAADGAAEDVDVSFAVRALEEPRDEVAFLGYGFLADRAYARHRFLGVRMAMRAAEDVADPVGLAGVERGLELLAARENRLADGTNPRFADIAAGKPFFLRLGPSSRGEEPVREHE